MAAPNGKPSQVHPEDDEGPDLILKGLIETAGMYSPAALREQLKLAFNEIDVDGGGALTLEELVRAFGKCGIAATEEAANAIMAQIDENNNGEVDVDEFITFFQTVTDLEELGDEMEAAETKDKATHLVLCCFLLLNMAVFLGAGFMWVQDDPKDEEGGGEVLEYVFFASSVTLGLMLFWLLIVPLLIIKLSPVVKAMNADIERRREEAEKRKEERKLQQQREQEAEKLKNRAWWELEEDMSAPQIRGYRDAPSGGLRELGDARDDASQADVESASGKPQQEQSYDQRYLPTNYAAAWDEHDRIFKERRKPFSSFAPAVAAQHQGTPQLQPLHNQLALGNG